MKTLFKKIKLLIIPIIAATIAFSSASYAKEMKEHKKSVPVFYNFNAEEQSMLYDLLYQYNVLDIVSDNLEENELCDYCELNNINPDPEKTEGCDFCQLFQKLPFSNLCVELNEKLTELYKVEIVLLKEKNAELAKQVVQFVEEGGYDSENRELKRLSTKIKKNGNFPNLLDYMSLYSTAKNEIIMFNEAIIQLTEIEVNSFFAGKLNDYKEFLDNQSDNLSNMQDIVNIGFKIEDPKCQEKNCPLRKIKTLSEIMIQVEKWQKSPKFSDGEMNDKLKDLL